MSTLWIGRDKLSQNKTENSQKQLVQINAWFLLTIKNFDLAGLGHIFVLCPCPLFLSPADFENLGF